MTKCLKFCSLVVLLLFIGTKTMVQPKSSSVYGPSEARWVRKTLAKMTLEARAVGIHMAYFPVVDVNINPDNPIINTRSFGENPAEVGRLAAAYIRGCQEYGLIATAKHFPGHGDTERDSHNVLATVQADMNRLISVELFPSSGFSNQRQKWGCTKIVMWMFW